MSSPPAPETTTAIDALAEPRRRYLLATLLELAGATPDRDSRSDRLPIETLATEVATREHGCPIVTDDQCERTHVALVHCHVPRLVEHGLLTRTTIDGTTMVGLADHPILEPDWVRTLLADPTGDAFPADEETLNRTLRALREPRNREVCAVLATRRGRVSVSDLAAAVVARAENGVAEGTDGSPEPASVTGSLVHRHLPALADAGLVAYDREAGRVALAVDAPQWKADWLLEGPLSTAAGLERRPDPRSDATEDRSEATDTPTAAAEPAADSGRVPLMLARPRANRSGDRGRSSSPELTSSTETLR